MTGKPWFGSPVRQYPELRVEYVPTPNLRRYAYATERWNRVLSAACYHGDNALFEQAVLSWYRRQPRGAFDLVQCCSLFALPERLLACYGQPVVSWLPGPPSGRVRRRLPGLLAQPHFGLFTHGATEWELNRLGYEAGRDFAIIEPGIDLEAADRNSGGREPLRARLGLGHQDLLGVTTARVVPIKNHDLLFRALAAAKAQGVIWHWLLLGDGPLDAELKLQAQALGLSSQVHFLGYQSQEEVHGEFGYQVDKIQVIPNGFDLHRFAPDAQARSGLRGELGVGPATPLVGMVARYDPQKNHLGFVAAAACLRSLCPEVHFVLAGAGVDENNQALMAGIASHSGLVPTFHLLGRREDIPRLMAALDVLVSPSSGEAFPNVLGEAMATGVPCVVTDVGDSAEIVGATGRVVPVGDMTLLFLTTG